MACSQTTARETETAFRLEEVGEGAVFTIERPGKLNALTKPVLEGLAAALDQLEARGARFLVITGRGERAFCAGTDLQEMQGMAMDARLAKSDFARALLVRLSRSPVLGIAAINGLALGGGMELAMACPLRISAPHASFGLPEIKLNLLPAYAGTQFLTALVGPSRALELMLTGRTFALEEAVAMGLVQRVSSDGPALIKEAIAFAREVTCNSAAAVEAIRDCVAAAAGGVTEASLATEGNWVRSVFSGPEAQEGVEAFLQKRPRKS